MTTDFASNSSRNLASAPGARQVVQRLRNDQDEIRLVIDVTSGAEATVAAALGGTGEQA